MRKPFDVLAEGLLSEKVGAAGFEPTTTRFFLPNFSARCGELSRR
jgi:hypothetical protein